MITLLIFVLSTVVCMGALLSFWKMEETLAQHGIHVRAFKTPRDISEAFDRYGALAREHNLSQWPRTMFVASFVGMVGCFFLLCLYVLPMWDK